MKKRISNIADRIASALNSVDGNMHPDDEKKPYADFKRSRESFYKRDLRNAITELKKMDLSSLAETDQDELSSLAKQLSELYEKNNRILMIDLAARLKSFSLRLRETESFRVAVPSLPADISGDVRADLKELENCFQAGCFRSVTILCGRILEVALHRKYYEVTGQDILETNPGIGLGKLIARLKEKKVPFDPGLTEQIHLINQVRVSSVHKKSEPFIPSKEQAHAMILYMLDALKKLF